MLDRPGNCCESCRRCRALRRSASPWTSSTLTPSSFESSGCPRSMIRACGRTIELKTHTSRFGGENESSSGSNRQVQPNDSCRSTPPSRTPSTSNATFYHAAVTSIFVQRRLPLGSRAASQPGPWRKPLRPTAPVNVSLSSSPRTNSAAGSETIIGSIRGYPFKISITGGVENTGRSDTIVYRHIGASPVY